MSKSYSNISPKPFKVWSADRQIRKSITAINLNEFKIRAAEKLGYEIHHPTNYHHNLRIVLESDGTEVEDDTYFQSAEKDTVFLLLRDNENWSPPGMDALKSALSAIPQIVCDTINSLKLANKSPAWSIKDDQGYITVTLQWEHDDKLKYLSDYEEPSWKLSSQQLQLLQPQQPQFHHHHHHQQPSSSSMPPSYSAQYGDKIYSSTFPRPSSSRTKSYEMYLRGIKNHYGFIQPDPHHHGGGGGYRGSITLPLFNKTLSADDFSFIMDRADADLSSAIDLTSYCDFHCSSLHRDGGSIKVSKSVGTSPILDYNRIISPIPTTTITTTAITTARMATATSASVTTATTTTRPTLDRDKAQRQTQQYDDNDEIRKIAQTTTSSTSTSLQKVRPKGHVRFMDIEKNLDRMDIHKRNISLMELINGHPFDTGSGRVGGIAGGGGGGVVDHGLIEAEGSETESETETTERDDEQLCERYLLLVDQLHANHKKHLSIKDIGIILERLKSKIIDIDKLERDKESIDCYNWLIKAIIKGDMLREIGVLYNGQYYSLMEHPGYF